MSVPGVLAMASQPNLHLSEQCEFLGFSYYLLPFVNPDTGGHPRTVAVTAAPMALSRVGAAQLPSARLPSGIMTQRRPHLSSKSPVVTLATSLPPRAAPSLQGTSWGSAPNFGNFGKNSLKQGLLWSNLNAA